jgi:hypothetical protein
MAHGLFPSGTRPRSWNRRWRAASSKLACRWLQHGEAASGFAGQYLRVPVDGHARNASVGQTLSGAGQTVVFTVVRGPWSTAGFPRKAIGRSLPVGLRHAVGINKSDSFIAPPFGAAFEWPASVLAASRTTRSRSSDFLSRKSLWKHQVGSMPACPSHPRPLSYVHRRLRFAETSRPEGPKGKEKAAPRKRSRRIGEATTRGHLAPRGVRLLEREKL